MTYTYKLARRLALGWGVAAVAACSGGTSPTDPPADPTDPPKLAVPELSPTDALLAPGGQLVFTAPADTDGQATFSATGGTIDPDGRYTAPGAAGTYLVVATWPSGRADTATVTVVVTSLPPAPENPAGTDPSPAPPELVELTLTPDTTWVAQGDTFRVEPAGRLVGGATVRPTVTYLATGGTIDEAGVFTAGMATGTFRITARSANGLVARTEVCVGDNVVKVLIRPASVSLAPGQTQQFTAHGVRISGDTVPVTVRWSATGGTITEDGLFTAGSTPGTIYIVADLEPPTCFGKPVSFDAARARARERRAAAVATVRR